MFYVLFMLPSVYKRSTDSVQQALPYIESQSVASFLLVNNHTVKSNTLTMASKTKAPDSNSRMTTRSTALKTENAPSVKRQTQKASTSSDIKYVYIVMVDSYPPYGETTSDIHAVYAALPDANNRLKALVNDEYSGSEDCKHGCKPDGRLYWSSPDAGEGERVEVKVQKYKVKQPGSEPECEWEEDTGGVTEDE